MVREYTSFGGIFFHSPEKNCCACGGGTKFTVTVSPDAQALAAQRSAEAAQRAAVAAGKIGQPGFNYAIAISAAGKCPHSPDSSGCRKLFCAADKCPHAGYCDLKCGLCDPQYSKKLSEIREPPTLPSNHATTEIGKQQNIIG